MDIEIINLFLGTFNGGNHVLGGGKIGTGADSKGTAVGLFGFSSGTIENLIIAGGSVVALSNEADAVFVGTIVGDNTGIIRNTVGIGMNIEGIDGAGRAGGICGWAHGSSVIEYCATYGNIITGGGKDQATGGICSAMSPQAIIRYSFAKCNVTRKTLDSTSSLGGIVGRVTAAGCKILNCVYEGDLTSGAKVNSTGNWEYTGPFAAFYNNGATESSVVETSVTMSRYKANHPGATYQDFVKAMRSSFRSYKKSKTRRNDTD